MTAQPATRPPGAPDVAGIDPRSERPSEPASYIRGAGGIGVDAGRLGRVILGLVLVSLLVLAAFLTVSVARQNDRINRLRSHGVPVTVTVTSCRGLASGTGITVAGFTCRGTYVLAGRQFSEVIRGSQALYASGQQVRALTLANDPAILTAAAAVASTDRSSRTFVTPAVLFLLSILGAGGLIWSQRRRSGRTGPAADSVAGPAAGPTAS